MKRAKVDAREIRAALESGEEEILPEGGIEKIPRHRRPADERPSKKREKARTQKVMIVGGETEMKTAQTKKTGKIARTIVQPVIEKAVVAETPKIRPVWPRVQAVVNQLLDIQNTDTCRVEVHKNEGQTFLTLTPDRNTGIATVPEGIFPNRWQLTCAFGCQKGLADGVAFIRNGSTVAIKSYRTLPPTAKAPALRLYNFARTEGIMVRALTIQVSSDRECLVKEWGISVLNTRSAKRTMEGMLVNERLPLHDMERTKKALPPTLEPLARELCFLYDRACGKPMPKPIAMTATQTAAAAQ